MNDIINKFLLAADKLITGMHLRESQFACSTFGLFTKNKERIQEFKETGDSRYIYGNELDKPCREYDIAFGGFKDLSRRTAADKDKAFNMAKDPKYDGYQRGFTSMSYKFFDKKTQGSGIKSMPQNAQLAEELQKPIIRK